VWSSLLLVSLGYLRTHLTCLPWREARFLACLLRGFTALEKFTSGTMAQDLHGVLQTLECTGSCRGKTPQASGTDMPSSRVSSFLASQIGIL